MREPTFTNAKRHQGASTAKIGNSSTTTSATMPTVNESTPGSYEAH